MDHGSAWNRYQQLDARHQRNVRRVTRKPVDAWGRLKQGDYPDPDFERTRADRDAAWQTLTFDQQNHWRKLNGFEQRSKKVEVGE